MNIDLDRGVTQRKHPDGYLLSMYKDTPGVYYLEDGTPCDVSMARDAGFPVEQHLREQKKRQLMDQYRQRLDRMMATEMHKIDQMVEQELEGTGQEPAPPPEAEPPPKQETPKPTPRARKGSPLDAKEAEGAAEGSRR